MKNKLIRSFLLTSIITLSMTSCHHGIDNNNNNNNPDALLINVNGDTHYGYKYTCPQDMNTFEPVDSLIKKANKGINTYLFTTSELCGHCQTMAPIYTDVINNNHLSIYTKALSDNKDEISEFNNFCSKINEEYVNQEGKILVDGANPRLYFLNNKKGYFFDIYKDNETYDKFSSFLNYKTKKSCIYEFSKIKSFKKALNENEDYLIYLFNYKSNINLDIYSELYKKYANNKSKKILLFNYHSLSQTDKKIFRKEFVNLDSDGCIKYKENVIQTTKDNVDKIQNIIDSYFK